MSVLKYIAIAGAALVGVVVVKRLVAPTTTPKPKSPIAEIFGGVTQLVSVIKNPGSGTFAGSGEHSTTTTTRSASNGSPVPLGDSPLASIPVFSADGDTAISDGTGTARTAFAQPAPTGFGTYEERATAGALPGSKLYQLVNFGSLR